MTDAAPPSSNEREKLGGDLVLPGLAVAFTTYFFYSVWDLSWEAKTNATAIGVTLLALIAILVVRVLLRVGRGEANLDFDSLVEPREVQSARFAVIGFTALFIVLIPWLGLTLGLFTLMMALMIVLRAGSYRLMVLTSATVSTAAYLLFIALLNSRLPRGPVEKLLATIF